ncbi:hypothetical protein EDB89DRAFT_982472 [Lactarius sanguifluus]|nr:hypothetical protein EDB89DRAFT_982472 [Lactarius sanguifluus]
MVKRDLRWCKKVKGYYINSEEERSSESDYPFSGKAEDIEACDPWEHPIPYDESSDTYPDSLLKIHTITDVFSDIHITSTRLCSGNLSDVNGIAKRALITSSAAATIRLFVDARFILAHSSVNVHKFRSLTVDFYVALFITVLALVTRCALRCLASRLFWLLIHPPCDHAMHVPLPPGDTPTQPLACPRSRSPSPDHRPGIRHPPPYDPKAAQRHTTQGTRRCSQHGSCHP